MMKLPAGIATGSPKDDSPYQREVSFVMAHLSGILYLFLAHLNNSIQLCLIPWQEDYQRQL